MAKKIDHRGVKMPPPTDLLFMAMAESCYLEMLDHAITNNCLKEDADDVLTWDKVPALTKERWIAGAKSMYAQVALFGGAKSTIVNVRPKS